jgi:2,3-bisphosphoglycerate-independent phosphoglycerate mutase
VGKVLEKKGTALVTADHGNAECKINSKGEESPSHTTNPVPFILVSEKPDLKNAKLAKGGSLIDIAPTILDIMNIKKPQEMTGESLILKQ